MAEVLVAMRDKFALHVPIQNYAKHECKSPRMIIHWKPVLFMGVFTFPALYFGISDSLKGCAYVQGISFRNIILVTIGLTVVVSFIHLSIKDTIDYRRRRKEEFACLSAGEDIPFYERVTTDEYYRTRKKTPRHFWIYTGISIAIMVGLISYSYYLGAGMYEKINERQEGEQQRLNEIS
ncbi:MAG: hypothetical protein ACRC2W_06520, partial [Plesiomonas shigelloides]